MKKIRICYPFVGDSIGGSHLSSIELIKKLDKKKFEVIPLLHKKGILYHHLINEGLKPQFLKIDDFVCVLFSWCCLCSECACVLRTGGTGRSTPRAISPGLSFASFLNNREKAIE